MSELQTIRRVTVYADSSLESIMIENFLALGANGYTLMECRGKGKHELVEDFLSGNTRSRIELLVQPPVADKIMTYLGSVQFHHHAVTACMETVQVGPNELF
jgi:hypothetical protein